MDEKKVLENEDIDKVSGGYRPKDPKPVALANELANNFASGLANDLADGLANDLANGLASDLADGLADDLASGLADRRNH